MLTVCYKMKDSIAAITKEQIYFIVFLNDDFIILFVYLGAPVNIEVSMYVISMDSLSDCNMVCI